jgi:hypothetical protein
MAELARCIAPPPGLTIHDAKGCPKGTSGKTRGDLMRTRLIAVLAGLVLSLSMFVVGGGASAANASSASGAMRAYNCVSNYEWHHFYVGNGKHIVERFFGTRGWLVWQHGRWQVKKYYHCGVVYDIVKIKYHWNGYSWRVYRAVRY